MDKTIIIIGAGASGFAAASKLMLNGFNKVVILEAENRIGGRVNTIPFASNVVDMGAQWCHGEGGNVVYEMAKDKNLLSSNIPRYDIFNFVRSDGETVSKSVSERLVNLATEILNRKDEQIEKRAYHGSLGNYFAGRFFDALRTPEYKDIESRLQHEVFDWLHQYRDMYVACDSWYDASCGNYLEYWDCPGDLLLDWKDRGYRTVLDLLQNKIPEGQENVTDIESKVLLNKEVTKIIYDMTSAEVNRIEIKCTDGSVYHCDHLICTVSLGVLKKNHLKMFEPLLPDEKIRSIESIGFGTVNKIYIEFTQSFWDKNWEGISFLWKPEQLREICEEDQINADWMKKIIGFYTVSYQPNILCGWITGNAARKMELANDKDFERCVKRVFNIFLKNSNITDMKRIIRSKWSSNPHFLGSYSYYSLESDAVGASTSVLAEPILDDVSRPIIQFSGEGTNTHYYSTVHGAVESGWREAQRLIDSFNT